MFELKEKKNIENWEKREREKRAEIDYLSTNYKS